LNIPFRAFLSILVLALPGRSELAWDFESAYAHPDAIDGVYGYAFPSKTSPGQTPRHVATLSRASIGGSTAAKLRFRLDGKDFPAAGFGIMFDDARPIDLRSLTTLRATLRSDRPRNVRLALMSSDPLVKSSADTGLTFGRDTLVGTAPVEWKITLADLSWPSWTTNPPGISRDAIVSRVFAIQLQVTCDGQSGVCMEDSGWIALDDLVLEGVGTVWDPPKIGDCSGERLAIDSFHTGPARQNDLGGWWYAYTDRSSFDPNSLGESRILNASVPESAQTWSGPSPTTHQASLQFQLKRKGVYSGYAAMETQLAPPQSDLPRPADFPTATSLAFDVRFDEDYPSELGGIVVHLRKSGKDFQGGMDHQVRIPWDSLPRRHCLDLGGFQQPSWSPWIVPFTPKSLLALSFEARLPASLSEAKSGFHVGDVAFHLVPGTSVHRRSSDLRPRILASRSNWRVSLGETPRVPTTWELRSLTGARIAAGTVPSGVARFDIPRPNLRTLSVLRIQSGDLLWTERLQGL
jgi:hypothetical protein